MVHEEQFISSLRSVVIHLIKHDQPMYKHFMDVVLAADEGRWHQLTILQKADFIEGIAARKNLLEEYYRNYPHHWSKQRYEDFCAALESYVQELKAARGAA